MSFHPHTPQSPSHCSPATSSDPNAGPSSAVSSTAPAALPTPAHSVNGSSSQLDSIMTDDSPHHKRKRSPEDTGDRDQKKLHLEDSKLGIEDLHLDVGEKYLLCQTRKAPFRWPLLVPSMDLLSRQLRGLCFSPFPPRRVYLC